VEIDSRPSDAIALAVQMKAPIYVDEKVLEDVLPAGGPDLPSEPGPEEEGDGGEEEK
jgi:hypothetical protein